MGNQKLLKRGEHVMGVDVGATKLMAVVYDHNFKPVGRCRKRTQNGRKERVEVRLVKAIREALEQARVKRVKGIGVGAPGPLNPETGVIIDTPNLAWKNFPLAKTLANKFKVPVAVDNDVNLGTYGEWRFGSVRDCQDVIGIFPGTGIGGGIIIDGRLYRGFSGAAGEVGHMTMQLDGPYCGCGKRGCLEAMASRIAIAGQVAELAARGDAPSVLAECGANLLEIRSGTLAKAIDAGETMVEGVVRHAAYLVGVGVANLINVLSPEAVVLGGGLVEAMTDLYLTEVRRAVKEHAMPFLRKKVRIIPAKLGDDAVAKGAAAHIAGILGDS
jgi:glucokinase